MRKPVGTIHAFRPRRNNDIHRVNRLKLNPLLVRVPKHLHHTPTTHQHMVDPAHHFRCVVTLLMQLIAEPLFSRCSETCELRSHRHERGQHLKTHRLLKEPRLQLIDGCVYEGEVGISSVRPRLVFTTQTVVTHLIPKPLPRLPLDTRLDVVQYLCVKLFAHLLNSILPATRSLAWRRSHLAASGLGNFTLECLTRSAPCSE